MKDAPPVKSFIPLALSRDGGGWQGVLIDGDRQVWECEHYHVNAKKNIGVPPMVSTAKYYAEHPEKRSARSCAVIEANRRLKT